MIEFHGSILYTRCSDRHCDLPRFDDPATQTPIMTSSCATEFLAGGLKAGNVRDAIDMVGPFGLDLCSGVRTDGRLDLKKLESFFNAFT